MGEVKVGKEPALAVQVSRKDFPTVTLFFDKKTHLLVKCEYKTKAADLEFKEVKMESIYSDHRDIDGIKMPRMAKIYRDGKLFVEGENTDMKMVGKLDDKVFSRPSSD
jgi:hypothetical protein